MKFTTTMGALALGLGLAVVAQAQPDAGYTPIYITGSTAFRSQVFSALNLDMGLAVQNGGTGSQNSFTLEGNITDVHSLGFTKIGDPVEVLCDFSGSAEGVQTVINNVANTYLSLHSRRRGRLFPQWSGLCVLGCGPELDALYDSDHRSYPPGDSNRGRRGPGRALHGLCGCAVHVRSE